MKKIAKEYRLKTIEELEKERIKLSEEIAKLKVEFKINQPKDKNLLFKKRKQLAVLLTILSEKKLSVLINNKK